MKFIIEPWQVFLLILSGLVNREQQRAIDYLRTENQVLRELAGKKRILLNDDQPRRLAVKGKLLGRRGLEQLATLVTPDTILRWHGRLVAEKRGWDRSLKQGQFRSFEQGLVVRASESPRVAQQAHRTR